MHHELLAFDERHVVDDQSQHALALTVRRGGIPPEAGDIVRQCQNAGPLFVVEARTVGVVLLSIAFLRFIQEAQFVIPVRFQRVGDQSIVGIDPHESVTREIDVVLRPVDGLATKGVGLV